MNAQVSMAVSPKKCQMAYTNEKPIMRANISMSRLLHKNMSGV